MKKNRKNKNRKKRRDRRRHQLHRLHNGDCGCPFCGPKGAETLGAMTPTKENLESWLANWDKMRYQNGRDLGDIVQVELVMSERDRKLDGDTPVTCKEFLESVKKLTRPAILNVQTSEALFGFPLGAPDIGSVMLAFAQDAAESDVDVDEAS